MKSDDIIYSTPEQQLKKLKAQNLIIEDEDSAKSALSLYGYSSLIKSYRDPYMTASSGQKLYLSGVSFDRIYSLYILDKNLRNAVMAAMIDLEEHIKETTADVIANSFGTHPDDYLKYRNYQNKRKRKYRFSLTGILETLNNTLNTDKNPIHHYQQEHGIVPPWILFKSVYFSTINNFIDQFKLPQQEQMIAKLYDLSSLGLPTESIRNLMIDTLFICQEYRNIAAHGGRIYNYIPGSTVRLPLKNLEALSRNKFSTSNNDLTRGISLLLFLLHTLKYDNPYQILNNAFSAEINRHCNVFEEDAAYLQEITGMKITKRHVVWVSDNTSKYHLNPHCSGLKDAYYIPFEYAIEKGYTPCSRCVK